ncbi:hypothetical protein D3C78_856010 [compost metagenome]
MTGAICDLVRVAALHRQNGNHLPLLLRIGEAEGAEMIARDFIDNIRYRKMQQIGILMKTALPDLLHIQNTQHNSREAIIRVIRSD